MFSDERKMDIGILCTTVLLSLSGRNKMKTDLSNTVTDWEDWEQEDLG